jgi:hypothetical protein
MRTANEEIEAKAVELFTKHGVEIDWVRNVLKKTIKPLDVEGDFYFLPSVETALEHLPVERVVALFQEGSFQHLGKMESLTWYLASPECPFYTLEELTEHVHRFLGWLESNKDHLIETGLPRTNFSESQWLSTRASNLLPCKLPCKVTASKTPSGGFEFQYAWSRERLDCARQLDADTPITGGGLAALYAAVKGLKAVGNGYTYLRRTRQAAQPTEVPYKDAAYTFGLSKRDGQRLDRERQKLFSVKGEILTRTDQALRDHDASSLREDIISILRKNFTIQDLLFYWEIESEYPDILGPLKCEPWTVEPIQDAHAGGVMDILRVANHCRAEIDYGGFDWGRGLLHLFPPGTLPSTYYAMLEQSPSERDEKRLDEWLGYMSDVLREWDTGWLVDFDRLRLAMRRSFDVEVSISRRVPIAKAKYHSQNIALVDDFFRTVRLPSDLSHQKRLMEWAAPIITVQSDQLEAGGDLLPLRADINTENAAHPGLRHNEDFTRVEWLDAGKWKPFDFNTQQATAFKHMFEEVVVRGNEDFHQKLIRGGKLRLRDLFRNHPALGSLITPCTGLGNRGRWRLNLFSP